MGYHKPYTFWPWHMGTWSLRPGLCWCQVLRKFGVIRIQSGALIRVEKSHDVFDNAPWRVWVFDGKNSLFLMVLDMIYYYMFYQQTLVWQLLWWVMHMWLSYSIIYPNDIWYLVNTHTHIYICMISICVRLGIFQWLVSPSWQPSGWSRSR